MSLLKFGFSTSKSAITEKDKVQVSKNEKDRLYDKQKRKRAPVDLWSTEFEWLEIVHAEEGGEPKLFCKYCKKYPVLAGNSSFVTGSQCLHKSTLSSHDFSKSHREVYKLYKSENSLGGPSNDEVHISKSKLQKTANTLHAAFARLNEAESKRMMNLFRIAYFLAKENKPISDMEKQCRLSRQLGVDVGENYHNDFSASQFIAVITENLKNDLIGMVKKCNFLCILADGSTDISVLEQELVYVRYIDDLGCAQTVMSSIIELEHGHALGVFDGIKNALKEGLGIEFRTLIHSEPGPNLVCANFDGASVMQGLKGGVVGHIKKEIPNIIPMHCVAHKLELAVLDCVKHLPFLSKYDDTIKGLFIMYRSSPKRLREVKAISSVLESSISQFTDLKKTRWVSSKGRAIEALRKNLDAVIVHLGAMAGDTHTASQTPEAKGYLNAISTLGFIKSMHLMLDFIPIINKVSQVFQYRDLMVFEISNELEGLLLELLSMRTTPQNFDNLRRFNDLLDVEKRKFGDIQLRGTVTAVDWKTDGDLQSLVDNAVN